jgi:hypothetical protein
MTKIRMLFYCLFICSAGFAQKVEYKSGKLSKDGTQIASVNKVKDGSIFNLTSSYELYNMAGEKQIIATVATEFVPQANDNTVFYYRFTFLPLNQVGIFSLSKLGAEKSFAKLIGESGILVNDKLDAGKVQELMAYKSKNPRVSTQYHLVQRNRMMNLFFKDDHTIHQGLVVIGTFRDITPNKQADEYEFALPEGLVVAKVVFTGGNNARNCILTTMKDNRVQSLSVSDDKNYKLYLSSIDRNAEALTRIVRKLMDMDYL